jgi:DNA-binding NarL/FixJ family response regulator
MPDRGQQVVTAVGDAEALRAAVDDHHPNVAVIDVRMPPGHTDEGLRAAIAIPRDHPDLKILVVSPYVEIGYAADLLRMRSGGRAGGGDAGVGYLLKDRVADVAEFVGALARVAVGGTALDPKVVAGLLGASRHASAVAALTTREGNGLRLMAEGRSNSVIAGHLAISERALERHIGKLGLPPSDTDHRRVFAVLAYLES